ncbi:MAG: SAM-dependent methyltransferase [Patiriisocius sp.]|jgi:SAM-dependent methyltransferase
MRKIIQFFVKHVPRHQLHKIAHFAMILVSPFYRGSNFEDPINGKKYRKMFSYGRNNPRANALAPDSMSLERHRLLWLFLRDRTNFTTENIKLLHLAPEYCFLKKFKKMNNLDVVTGDLYSPWADIKMDVHDIPFDNNSFDVLLGNHLLEHVDDDAKVMREFYRVMKPGGWGIFQVPMDTTRQETYEDASITDPKEREKHFWQEDHLRLYGLDYPKRLSAAGFEVVQVDLTSELDPKLVQRYSLPIGEIIYWCKKN